MTGKKERVLNCLHTGKENAVSRYEIEKITGIDERTVREIIKRIVTEDGIPILSSSSAKGYWISEDLEEMRAYVRESDSREATLRRNVDPIRKIITRKSGKETTYRRRHKEPKPPRQIEGQISLIGG